MIFLDIQGEFVYYYETQTIYTTHILSHFSFYIRSFSRH